MLVFFYIIHLKNMLKKANLALNLSIYDNPTFELTYENAIHLPCLFDNQTGKVIQFKKKTERNILFVSSNSSNENPQILRAEIALNSLIDFGMPIKGGSPTRLRFVVKHLDRPHLGPGENTSLFLPSQVSY